MRKVERRTMEVPTMYDTDYQGRKIFSRFLAPGLIHILLGTFLIVLGITDTAYTRVEFGPSCNYTEQEFDPGPCYGTHVYTYISSPVWGGVLMILTGSMTFFMNSRTLSYNQWLVQSHCGSALILFIAICPAIVTLNILEITQNENTFWKSEDYCLKFSHLPKFCFVMVMIILAGFEWIVSLVSLCVCLCCLPTDLLHPGYNSKFSREYGDQRFPYGRNAAPIFNHPIIIKEDPKHSNCCNNGCCEKNNHSRTEYNYQATGRDREPYYLENVENLPVVRSYSRPLESRKQFSYYGRDRLPEYGRRGSSLYDINRSQRIRRGEEVVYERRIHPRDPEYRLYMSNTFNHEQQNYY